jgi:hypothetical protein
MSYGLSFTDKNQGRDRYMVTPSWRRIAAIRRDGFRRIESGANGGGLCERVVNPLRHPFVVVVLGVKLAVPQPRLQRRTLAIVHQGSLRFGRRKLDQPLRRRLTAREPLPIALQ